VTNTRDLPNKLSQEETISSYSTYYDPLYNIHVLNCNPLTTN